MYRILLNAGNMVVFSAIKILAGSLVAFALHYILERFSHRNDKQSIKLCLILSMAGTLVPLDTLAIVPILIVLFKRGFKIHHLISFLISNSIFNMLMPFTDIGFQWQLGFSKMALAIIIGFIGGCLVAMFKIKGLMSEQLHQLILPRGTKWVDLFRHICLNILILSLFSIVGSLLHEFLYYDAINAFKSWFYATPFGFTFGRILSKLNLFNNFFFTALSIVENLINPIWLVSLFSILKPKGAFLLYLYMGVWSVLLAVSLFIS